MTTQFENIPCTRCGGTGHYSFNLMYGTVCFRCGGKKWEYTKRGKVAHDYYESMLTVLAKDITPGMYLWDGMSRSWQLVQEVTHEWIKTDKMMWGCAPETPFRRKPRDAEEYQTLLQKALDYQAGLTKTGKPKKGTK